MLLPHSTHRSDVAVVGGGLAGLAAATSLARAGRSVVVFERSQRLGGRAKTRDTAGFAFNLGAHALYAAGAGARVLAGLGVEPTGGTLRVTPSSVDATALARFPGGPLQLFTPRRNQVRTAFASLLQADPRGLDRVSVRRWLDEAVDDAEVRDAIHANIRVSTYADEPERLSAGAALDQLRILARGGVRYFDGGWQSLIDALLAVAQAAGVAIQRGERIVAVARDGLRWALETARGDRRVADAVIVTGSPSSAAALVQGEGRAVLRQWSEAALPVRAASLTVGLARLPRPDTYFEIAVNRPWYFSVHSLFARLAPDEGATIHLLKYLSSGDLTGARTAESELDTFLDLLQPDWRRHLRQRSFLPRMIVAHALPLAAAGGTMGRPGPEVAGLPGLYVAGDWVGTEGMLADAALASAATAATLIIEGTQRALPRPA